MSLTDVSGQVDWSLNVQPVDRLLSAGDLESFPKELPSGPVDYELDNGRLVLIMSPPGFRHGSLQARLSGYLLAMGELKGHGRVLSETGVILWRNPDRVVSPDVAFVAADSFPVKESREGYLETIPQLVVEIRSKNDSAAYIRRKVEHYLKAGVALVWVADPEAKSVTAHTAGTEGQTHGLADSLTAPSIIPGFSLAVADVFRE